MKVLKVLFYIVLFLALIHLLFHLYFLYTPYGTWFNENGQKWKIESLDYTYAEIHNQSVLINKDISEMSDEVSGNSFEMAGMNGRAAYTVTSEITENWYRCPFCYPTYYYASLTSK